MAGLGACKAAGGASVVREALLGRLDQGHVHCSRRPDIPRGLTGSSQAQCQATCTVVAVLFILILKLFGKRHCLESLPFPIVMWGNASGSALRAAASQVGLVVKYLYVPQQGSFLWPGQASFRRWCLVSMESDLQTNPS